MQEPEEETRNDDTRLGDEPNREDSVERVVAEWRAGTPLVELFERLHRLLVRPITGLFLRQGCSPEDSADLTQDTFVRILENRDSYRGESKFETWVFRIAMNVLRQSLRHQAAQKRGAELEGLPDDERESPAAPPQGPFPKPPTPADEWVLKRERQRILLECIDQLPAQMGQCVRLRVRDLKYREVAVAMRLSVNTVRSHLFQARQKLEACLPPEYKGPDLSDHE